MTRFHRGEPLPAVEDVDLLVVLGGPMNVDEESKYPWLATEKRFIAAAIAAERKVLGVCLGAQLVASVLGARVYANPEKEIGWFPIEPTGADAANGWFGPVPRGLEAFHWHGDTFDIPAGALHVARSAACAHQAFVHGERVVGLQFHLEVTRAAVRQLIAHGSGDLVAGRYVQKPQEMLAGVERFESANRVLDGWLDRLAVEASNRAAREDGTSCPTAPVRAGQPPPSGPAG
ncbi:MAG: type 1 glutamine amidotransferase [Thermoanaerobaculia bacterium]